MEKDWDKKACWQKWIEEEQTCLYSLAFLLTKNRKTALALTKEAIMLAYRSYQELSKEMFLRAVTDNICRLHQRYFPLEEKRTRELEQVVSTLLQMEAELRLLVLFYCVLQFDRETLATKLEWSQERLNTKLNQALAKVSQNFLHEKLIIN